jgi:hypothetical protein
VLDRSSAHLRVPAYTSSVSTESLSLIVPFTSNFALGAEVSIPIPPSNPPTSAHALIAVTDPSNPLVV